MARKPKPLRSFGILRAGEYLLSIRRFGAYRKISEIGCHTDAISIGCLANSAKAIFLDILFPFNLFFLRCQFAAAFLLLFRFVLLFRRLTCFPTGFHGCFVALLAAEFLRGTTCSLLSAVETGVGIYFCFRPAFFIAFLAAIGLCIRNFFPADRARMCLSLFSQSFHPCLMLTFLRTEPMISIVFWQLIDFCSMTPTIGTTNMFEDPLMFTLVRAELQFLKFVVLKRLAAVLTFCLEEDRLLITCPIFPDTSSQGSGVFPFLLLRMLLAFWAIFLICPIGMKDDSADFTFFFWKHSYFPFRSIFIVYQKIFRFPYRKYYS